MSAQNEATPGPGALAVAPPVGASGVKYPLWRAFFLAVGMVWMGCAMNRHHGRAWSEALPAGVAAGLVWLVGSWPYHLVSRRDDGVLIPLGFMLPFLNSQPLPSIVKTIFLAVVAALFGTIFGLVVRLWHRRRRGKRP